MKTDELNDMCTHLSLYRKGQLLIEVLFAVGLFTVTIGMLGFLISDARVSARSNIFATKGMLLAREGIEAVRSIRDDDFDNLVTGSYGVSLSGGSWVFVPDSDTTGVFTRIITIGDVEAEVKLVTSNVSWSVGGSRSASRTLTRYVTDWKQSEGDAGTLVIDGTGTTLLVGATTTLSDIALENISGSSVTLSMLSIEWNGAEQVVEVVIDGVVVYTSLAGISSGDEIDIANHTITGGNTDSIETISFNGPISAEEFLITFIMSDGSRTYLRVVV